jgi:hypothetical protein
MKIIPTFEEFINENLNLKAGKVYDEVKLEPLNNKELKMLGGDFGYNIFNVKNAEIGTVILKNIDGVKNVIYSIFILPEHRNKSYAIPTYVKLAENLGYVCSGEYLNDGSTTKFVSADANNVWMRLNEIFRIDKIKIQGNKFRYCLKKENL